MNIGLHWSHFYVYLFDLTIISLGFDERSIISVCLCEKIHMIDLFYIIDSLNFDLR